MPKTLWGNPEGARRGCSAISNKFSPKSNEPHLLMRLVDDFELD